MRRGNGEGSIFKLGGKRRKPYAVRVTTGFTPEGKQIYKYLGYYTTKTEAKTALYHYLVNPYNLMDKDVTVFDVYTEWEKSTDLAATTQKGYVSAFRQCPELYKIKMRDVKIAHLKETMLKLRPTMQPNFKSLMSHLFDYAIENEIVDKNLSAFLTPQKIESKRRLPFTLEQVNRIKTFKHRYNNIAVILLYTGMRITELLEMKKENVNIEQRYFYGGKKTQAGRTRITPIHDDIFEIVKKYYESSEVYLIENNEKPVLYRSFMKAYWEPLKNYLGSDLTPHSTRHTFITFADRCGLNQTIVKKIVGHSRGDITDHYTHKDIEELLNEMNKLKYE